MNLITIDPASAIQQFLLDVPATRRLLIGYSGGMDSHALLQAVVLNLAKRPDLEVVALHVDHGLQRASGDWARHCRDVCRRLGVRVQVLQADIDVDAAIGVEASARRARYGLFSSVMHDSDYLLLAQHADDQAETFLLQALRGSGPDGLASIPRKRNFGPGWLCRPLLGLNRRDIERWAQRQALDWIEDPSNQNTRFDRNFLRHEIIPLLRSRWPALNQTLSRSASRCGAASQLLLSLASDDLELVRCHAPPVDIRHLGESRLLEIPLLVSLGQERVYNVLRLWVREAGYELPRLQDLKQVESNLLQGENTGGVVNVRGYEFRRYGDQLYLLPPQPVARPYTYEWTAPYYDLSIPEAGLTLTVAQCAAQGLHLPRHASVRVQNRAGGELIRLGNPVYHKPVKKLLQEARVPPWQRNAIPLIYINGQLAAVWKIAVTDQFQTESV